MRRPAPSVRSQALRLGAMGVLALCWIALDQAVKFRLNAHAAGSVLSDPVAGLFRLHLVHNTGGAWSMFSGATAALGVFSIVMCAALAAFAVHERARISWPELIGLGLVIGGGHRQRHRSFRFGATWWTSLTSASWISLCSTSPISV